MADPIVETTDANGEATFTLDDYERDHDTYTATISKTHYVTATKTFEVTKDEEFDIVLEALPILTLTVTDGTDAISGATVTIGEDSDTTDANGEVEFYLEYGDYSATIEADGYTTATESLAFRSNHKNFSVTLETAVETGTVTVTCQDEISEVSGATVALKLDGETVASGTSGSGGVCVLEDVPYNTYTLQADFSPNFISYTGELVVDGDETVTITLS